MDKIELPELQRQLEELHDLLVSSMRIRTAEGNSQSLKALVALLREQGYKSSVCGSIGANLAIVKEGETIFETNCKINVDNYRDFIAYFLGGPEMVEEYRNLSILD